MSAGNTMRQTGLGGAVLPWQDVLHEGPVPLGVRSALLRARAEFLAGCGWGSRAALQAQLDTFAAYYNTQRPHRAIGRRTPADAYAARPHAGPRRQGILVDEHFRVRKDRVDRDGKLTLRHASRLHHIGIGHRWTGTPLLQTQP